MTIKQFFEKFNLNTKGIEIKQSEKTYKGTTDNILFITLENEVDGQDYLVMSHNLATKVATDPSALASASATHTDEGWGLICASTVTVLGSIDL